MLASGSVQPDLRTSDPDQFREARRLMALGEGDALIRDPKRDFPSYTSAATFMDIDAFLTDPLARDFLRVPLLAFSGTRDDARARVAPAGPRCDYERPLVRDAPMLTVAGRTIHASGDCQATYGVSFSALERDWRAHLPRR